MLNVHNQHTRKENYAFIADIYILNFYDKLINIFRSINKKVVEHSV